MDIIKLNIPLDISNYTGLVKYIMNNYNISATTANSFFKDIKRFKI